MFYCPDEDTIIFTLSSSNVELLVHGSPNVDMVIQNNNGLTLDYIRDYISITESEVLSIIRSENVFANYKTQDVDDAGLTTYVGELKPTGEWLIKRIVDTSGDLAILYANESNNPAKTSYALAWTDRASLTYNLIETLTGL